MILIYLILIAVASSFLLNFLYKRTNHFNNQFVDVRKFWKNANRQENLQVVNLGSNHPKFGLDYSDMGIKGENWAVGPQTFEYDFAILRQNVGYLAPGAVVIIPVCLLNFFLFRQKNRGTHAKYYTFLPKEDIVGYNAWERLRNITFPVIDPRTWRFILRDVPKDNRFNLTTSQMKSKGLLEKDADMWINIWNKEFSITLPEISLSEMNKCDIKNNIRVLNKMLDFCKAKGFKPVLAILPVTNYLSSRFTDSFIETHIINYLNEANTVNAPLLDYLRDERFTDSSLYINSFFMNKAGRKEFSKVFIEDLKTKRILQ